MRTVVPASLLMRMPPTGIPASMAPADTCSWEAQAALMTYQPSLCIMAYSHDTLCRARLQQLCLAQKEYLLV